MIRIIVDSSADYRSEELKEKNIEIVPLTVMFGDQTYIEGQNLTRDGFYEMLSGTEDFPTTSQPSPEKFLEIFKDARENGDDVICILLSSALSGTCQSALLAKNIADYDNIYIIDSLSATHPIRFMVDYACKLREESVPANVIAEKVESLKSRTKVIAALDTLEYLKRGGRISKTAAAIGDLANIKPIITVTEEGTVAVLGKALGKNKAVSSLIKSLQTLDIDPDFPIYSVYTYGQENCERLEKKMEANSFEIVDRLQVGTVIGTHVGPGAFGYAFVQK